MSARKFVAIFAIGTLAVFRVTASFVALSATAPVSLAPGVMPRMGTVDERSQSFNIEMLEGTGGNFWKPYSKWSDPAQKPGQSNASVPAGMNHNIYQYRPPIDLTILDYASWRRPLHLHTCASAERGPIPPIFRIRVIRPQRRRQKASTACLLVRSGRESSIFPMQ